MAVSKKTEPVPAIANAGESIAKTLQVQGVTESNIQLLLGNVCRDNADIEGAIIHYQRAILAKPDFAEAHAMMGWAYYLAGDHKEALSCCRRAMMFDQQLPSGLHLLGQIWFEQGELQRALLLVLSAIKQLPENQSIRKLYYNIINRLPVSEAETDIRPILEELVNKDITLDRAFLLIINRIIISKPEIRSVSQLLTRKEYAALDELLANPETLEKLRDSLLAALMSQTLVTATVLELLFNRLRFILLTQPTLRNSEAGLYWSKLLWAQGFINEYVMYRSAEELEEVNRLEHALNSAIAQGKQHALADIAILGAYKPLAKLEAAHKLLEFDYNDAMAARLLDEHISNVLKEKHYAAEMPSLTEVEDAVSQKVREQYEENPYPRWHKLTEALEIDFTQYLCKRIVSQAWKKLPHTANPKVLIAGCGTGKHALEVASNLRKVDITAIDLSRASLAYAKRKAEELKFENVRFFQADILKLDTASLPEFDLIECAGVLHHMKDPMAGWRQLVALLKPEGVMKVALYSEIARHEIALARQSIESRGIGSMAEDIREFRREILEQFLEGRPSEFLNFHDFYSLSECRDLLFHVQEHRFTLLQLAECLEVLGLEFLGFEFEDIELRKIYRKRFPEDAKGLNLANWHEFEKENPKTFKSMYQFWVQRK